MMVDQKIAAVMAMIGKDQDIPRNALPAIEIGVRTVFEGCDALKRIADALERIAGPAERAP